MATEVHILHKDDFNAISLHLRKQCTGLRSVGFAVIGESVGIAFTFPGGHRPIVVTPDLRETFVDPTDRSAWIDFLRSCTAGRTL